MSFTRFAINLSERGMLPDTLVRQGIRRLLDARLAQLPLSDTEQAAGWTRAFLDEMRAAPIAVATDKANAQHYEVPAAFFELVLGPQRKYSCCHFPAPTSTLAAAEEDALRITAERAGLADGMDILELGCGWGSLTLWMARRFPQARITAVSNSRSQRELILGHARQQQLVNINVITADMNSFDIDSQFDRVVSVEMFEHMRNWERLFAQIDNWLRPQGRFFMHIFCHRSAPYLFDAQDDGDWMGRQFFSGGMMPSDELPLRCGGRLRVLDQWRWSGVHYQRTAAAWLRNMDESRDAVGRILAGTYGTGNVEQWRSRWRMFFMACEELFGFNDGQEWWVSHYLLDRQRDGGASFAA
jgi:cyclopropane-fatty-acyl-phospholipid synthase